MSAADTFLHQVKQAAQQQMQDGSPFVYGHIANYDPKINRVRVILPSVRDEDGNPVLSPWMQLGSAWAGNEFGMQVAPRGGATLKNPTAGEQVLVARIDRGQGFGAVLMMGFNQVTIPPVGDLKPGEAVLMALGGSFVRFNEDKSIVLDTSQGPGKVTINAGAGEVDITATIVNITGNLALTGDFRLGGAILSLMGGIYAGALEFAGEIYAKFGTGGQVGLSTHSHHQGVDSHGDTEVPTDAPTGGT